MSPAKLVPLAPSTTSVTEGWPGATPTPRAAGSPTTPSSAEIGYKAARLAAALRAGLPVLPGFVVPAAEARPSLQAAASAVRAHGIAAGRPAVLARTIDLGLSEELRGAVDGLGGRVIVRSSSPLEGDGRWAGAFSSVTGVRGEDVATAVRSCWASVLAVDPLRRLEGCGLELAVLDLAVLVQPEIVPEAGGVARTSADEVIVEGVPGHPGMLLSGWTEGASARVRWPGGGLARDGDGGLAGLVGLRTVADVAELAGRVHAELGDDVIEWAACGGSVWLLQSQPSAPRSAGSGSPSAGSGSPSAGSEPAAALPVAGTRVPGTPAVPGTAAGPLVACRPHEPAARECRGAVVLVDRPVPGLAPLLFGARGVISRAGAANSHLAEVARSLGVPMVIGCRPEAVTGPDPAAGAWFATINGGTGEVVLTPA